MKQIFDKSDNLSDLDRLVSEHARRHEINDERRDIHDKEKERIGDRHQLEQFRRTGRVPRIFLFEPLLFIPFIVERTDHPDPRKIFSQDPVHRIERFLLAFRKRRRIFCEKDHTKDDDRNGREYDCCQPQRSKRDQAYAHDDHDRRHHGTAEHSLQEHHDLIGIIVRARDHAGHTELFHFRVRKAHRMREYGFADIIRHIGADPRRTVRQQARSAHTQHRNQDDHKKEPVQDVRITAVDPLVDHLRDDRRDAQLGQRKTENRNKIKNKEFSIFFRKIPYQSHDLLQKERDNRLSLIVDKY